MNRSIIGGLGLLAVLVIGCEDFMAEDVSDQMITLRAPADEASSETAQITFWWDALPINTGYRLQVVRPSFEQATSLVLDTLVYTYQVPFSLDSGRYAWRVRAENATYSGAYSPAHRFTITASQ